MFTILYRPNGSQQPRLGLAIGKKNCRQATQRNRLKRVIRESFRHHRHGLGGMDIVVINQAAAAGAANKQLFDSLEKHWQRCQAGSAHEAGKKIDG